MNRAEPGPGGAVTGATRLFANPKLDRRSPGPGSLTSGFDPEAMAIARQWIAACPHYRPSPVHGLPGLARHLALGACHLMDETGRFGLGAFKALGGAYAVLRQVRARTGATAAALPDLGSAAWRAAAEKCVVTCATDGNHGRSVAAGARLAGCRCVIFLHEDVSAERAAAIAHYGAETIRVPGDYDDSVAAAARAARDEGWILVADTSDDPDDPVPAQVMSGYGVSVDEALRGVPAMPTHVFVQAGVGGFAAAVLSVLWHRFGAGRPVFVVVEPDGADCLAASAIRGHAAPLDHPLRTDLGMLSCGEPSMTAWPLLDAGADFFMTIADEQAFDAVRLLANGRYGDRSIAVGESGAAGLAGAIAAATDPGVAAKLDIDESSKVLVFATEEPTDRIIYDRIMRVN